MLRLYDVDTTMICPSCQRDAGTGPLCTACGAIQPARSDASFFEILGLRATFFLGPEEIEDRFKDMNKKLHPDRFAQREPRERRLSLEWTTRVNDAWRTLKDPLKRATYLLKTLGIDVEKESGPDAMKRLPPEFLEQVMVDREALDEAKAKNDLAKVRMLSNEIDLRAWATFESLSTALKAFEAGDRNSLEKAASALAVLKYFSRHRDEVEAIEVAALE